MSNAADIPLPKKPPFLGARSLTLLSIATAGLVAGWGIGLHPSALAPSGAGWGVTVGFLQGAITPALDYQGAFRPAHPPFLVQVASGAWSTIVYAAASVGLSAAFGLPMGLLGSTAWWSPRKSGPARTLRTALRLCVRVVIAASRSVHELLWAVLFLAALGLTPTTAILAISIPYSGTLAKIYAELIDEAPRDAANALRLTGASAVQVFTHGLMPKASADMTAYTLYRLECALRASAVLGFFGIPGLGVYIRLAFENRHYSELWTYLYTLVVLVAATGWWSGAIRKRLGS